MTEIKHIYNYGTFNENIYFTNMFKDSFDMVRFNANILAYAPQGIATFICKFTNKSFYIDPLLYAFQSDQKKSNSVKKLAKKYGIDLDRDIKEYASQKEIHKLIENVVNFQLNVFNNAIQDNEVAEFINTDDLEPNLIVAPSFYIDSDEYCKINYRLIKETCDKFGKSREIYYELMTESMYLDSEMLSHHVKEVSKIKNLKGFIVWIDDFNEHDRTIKELCNYIKLLKNIKSHNFNIINSHGSYFSILLLHERINLLDGVGHGIEYGEYRPVFPVGGGLPSAKFYYPLLYKRINYEPDAIKILLLTNVDTKKKYFEQVCDCKMCNNLIEDNIEDSFHKYGITKLSKNPKHKRRFPTYESKHRSRCHYLLRKDKEYSKVNNETMENLIDEMNDSFSFAKKYNRTLSDIGLDLSYLGRWHKILQKLI